MAAIKQMKGRKLYIDMDEIEVPEHNFLDKTKKVWDKEPSLKSLDPFNGVSNQRRKFETPEKLQEAVNSYFNSCFGPGYYKGKPILDAEGNQAIIQREPFTVSGLARHLGIGRTTLMDYENFSKAGLIAPEYAEIIVDAKLRIQEYAEKRLYDRDGSSGARFVLEAGFGWITQKEAKELKQNKKRLKIAQEKLKLAQEAAHADQLEDKQFVVNILRAGEDIDNQ